jgi:hypothetical protein
VWIIKWSMSYLYYRLNYELPFNLCTYAQIFQNSLIFVNNSHFTFQCFTVNGQDSNNHGNINCNINKRQLIFKSLFTLNIQLHWNVPQWRVSYSLLWCLFYSLIKCFHKRLLFTFHCLKLNWIKISKCIWKCLLQRCMLE